MYTELSLVGYCRGANEKNTASGGRRCSGGCEILEYKGSAAVFKLAKRSMLPSQLWPRKTLQMQPCQRFGRAALSWIGGVFAADAPSLVCLGGRIGEAFAKITCSCRASLR